MNTASSQRVKVATILLAALAAGLAGLLLYQSQSSQALPGCDGGSGCDTVLSSKWSLWLGIPVSLLAMLVYTAMLAAAVARDPSVKRPQPAATATMALTAIAAIAAALWFVGVQVVAIGALCKYCIATHAVGVTAAALCLTVALPQLKQKALASTALAAFGLTTILIAGQLIGEAPERPEALVNFADDIIPEPEFEDPSPYISFGPTPIDPLLGTPDDNALPKPETPDAKPIVSPNPATETVTPASTTGPRLVKLYGGKLEVDSTSVPIVGDPYAPKVMVILYDYTCSHCRDTRTMLERTKSKHGNNLAILCLPTPLNKRCNPMVKHNSAHNKYACDLARISLAFWKIAPDKWAEFDKQLYSNEDILTPARARIAAGRLVKDKDLAKALKDPWIDQQILRDVSMYANAAKATGNAALPMLITDQGAMNGSPKHPLDIDDLINGKRR